MSAFAGGLHDHADMQTQLRRSTGEYAADATAALLTLGSGIG